MPHRVSMNSEQVSIIFWGLIYLKEVISVDSSRIQVVKVWIVSKPAHFILFRVSQFTEVLTGNYIREIVQLHGIPIILCRIETRDSDHNFVKVFKEV